MRQAGILAAAALYALDHHLERLADDHRAAQLFADELRGAPGIELPQAPIETNIIQFAVTRVDASEFARRAAEQSGGRLELGQSEQGGFRVALRLGPPDRDAFRTGLAVK